jgi:hypothetical protein
MATQINEIVGATASYTLQGQEAYERVFELIFDSPVFNAADVVSNPLLPPLQSLYAPWSAAIHDARQARHSGGRAAPNIWTVTCRYSSQQNTNQNEQRDPELVAPKISWSSSNQQVYRERDRRGKKKCNSAGDPFIPITPTYESIKVATVKYFVRTKPAGLLDLVNKINSNTFTVDGEYVAKNCCRIADIQVSEPRIERGVVGRDITVQFQIGPTKTLNKAGDVIGVGFTANVEQTKTVGYWIPESLDRGRREIKAISPYNILIPVVTRDGSEPTEPSLLDGQGVALDPPVADGSEVYRYWYDYEEADFSLIRLQ